MKVVIIGTGNTATILGKKIQAAGHEILQVVGRSFERTNLLASLLNSNAAYNPRYINLFGDIYIIAVSDSVIPAVALQLKLKNKVVVHTAAAVSKNVLAISSENYGVIYPLQTLVKERSSLPSIPVLVDGNNETTKKELIEFSSDWSDHVATASDDERLKLHVAAVFVSNFSNYLFTIGEQFCKEERLKFSLLYPLIEETVERLKSDSPSANQTGPAVREDYLTIEKHKKILESYPEIGDLYSVLTNSIISFYNKK